MRMVQASNLDLKFMILAPTPDYGLGLYSQSEGEEGGTRFEPEVSSTCLGSGFLCRSQIPATIWGIKI